MWVVVDPRTKEHLLWIQGGVETELAPRLMLKDFQGKLQSDGYVVYDVIDAELSDIDHFNCWTPGRKFIEALSDNKAVCEHTLMLIQNSAKLKLGVEMIVVVLMKDTNDVKRILANIRKPERMDGSTSFGSHTRLPYR